MPLVEGEMVRGYVHRLNDALNDIHVAIAGYQGRETRLRSEFVRITEDFESKRGELRRINEGLIRDHRRNLHVMNEEHERSHRAMGEKHKSSLQQSNNLNAGLKKENDKLRGQLGNERERSSQLAARVGELESALQQAKQPLDENAYNILRQNYDFLVVRYNTELEESRAENASIRREVEDSRAENASMREQVTETNAENERVTADLEQSLADIRNELEAAIAENERLAEQDYVTFTDNDRFRIQIESLQKIIHASDNEKATLRSQIENIQSQRGNTTAMQRQWAADNEALRQRLLQCSKDNKALRQQLLQCTNDNGALQKESLVRAAEIKSLQDELEGVRQELAVKNMDPQPGDQTLNVTDDSGGQHQDEVERLEMTIRELTGDNQNLTDANRNLIENLNSLNEENQRMRADCSNLQESLDRYTKLISDCEERIVLLNGQLTTSEEENERVKVELNACTSRNDELTRMSEEFDGIMQDRSRTEAAIQAQLIESQEENQKKTAEITSLTETIRDERVSYDELIEELRTAREELRKTRADLDRHNRIQNRDNNKRV